MKKIVLGFITLIIICAGCMKDSTSKDCEEIKNIIMKGITPTIEQLNNYDYDQDGQITSADFVLAKVGK